mmetsp:Transcript_8797/g.16063  ORF Transcript_8797/g.16063 Transcript_8797/m.16063 type:complete len:183 (-) Transcript_8797:238-786(-)
MICCGPPAPAAAVIAPTQPQPVVVRPPEQKKSKSKKKREDGLKPPTPPKIETEVVGTSLKILESDALLTGSLMAEDGPPGMFKVNMVKPPGESWGMDIDYADGDALKVATILSTGHIAEWNRNNPARQIEKGDRIIEVNKEGSSAVKMAMQLYSKNFADLIVKKATLDAEVRAPTSSGANQG